ncbi:MAG: nucleotidyltransferase family protein [bacterium]|nr:nucleotidyltransferase family protein [bacterium]
MSRAAETLVRSLVAGGAPALPAAADWPEVHEILQSHRLGAWAWSKLASAAGGDEIPFHVRTALYAEEWHVAETNRRFARETSTLLAAFRERDVNPIVMKGMALLALVYRDVGARPMDDVDLLITAEERPRAQALLAELGFEQAVGIGDADEYFGPAGLVLDLHHRFRLHGGRDLAALTIDAAAPLLGTDSIRVFSPEAMVAHLVRHLVGHRRSAGILLAWVLDIALALDTWHDRLDMAAVETLLPPGPSRTALPLVIGFCVHRLGVRMPKGSGEPHDVWSFDQIVRARRRAMWNLRSPRGWAALGAAWLGRSGSRDRPRLRAKDLALAPFDILRESIRHRSGAASSSRKKI